MTPNVIRQNQVDQLIKDTGVFFAFSKEQFETGKTPLADGDTYVSIGMGGYMPKSNVDTFTDGMKAIEDQFKQAMKDEQARKEYIKYELNNHEAYYTHCIDSTMDALGSDFTREEVLAVFDGRRKLTK
jgi:hypothetical protein